MFWNTDSRIDYLEEISFVLHADYRDRSLRDASVIYDIRLRNYELSRYGASCNLIAGNNSNFACITSHIAHDRS